MEFNQEEEKNDIIIPDEIRVRQTEKQEIKN